MKKIVVGIAGASGSLYARSLLDSLAGLSAQWTKVGILMSENAMVNWELEIGKFDKSVYPFDFYESKDFMAPFASGSAKYDTMIVIPCSMGTLARIAAGFSDDLMTRAADVILKERRKLILVPRETPLSLIHIENMLRVTQAGAIVCPAVPSFYNGASTPADIAKTVSNRVLDLAGFEVEGYRWGEE